MSSNQPSNKRGGNRNGGGRGRGRGGGRRSGRGGRGNRRSNDRNNDASNGGGDPHKSEKPATDERSRSLAMPELRDEVSSVLNDNVGVEDNLRDSPEYLHGLTIRRF